MIGVVDSRLVLGLGGTVDYEIRWDSDVVERLVREHGIRPDELDDTTPIIDERSLVQVVCAFVASGQGGERFVADSTIVERFAARFDTEVTLGGTGVRAGLALARLGIPSVQHLVSIDETVRRLLPAEITIVSSATEDTLDPHLIVQYPKGATIAVGGRTIRADRANRVILANDPPNRSMRIAPELGNTLATASAFVVSGFNTMQDAALLETRLDDLETAMDRLPADAIVYYEEAGFYEPDFSARVRQRLLPRIDVLGMNEDELQERVGRRVDLRDPHDVARAVDDIHERIPVPTLVVHAASWAVAVGPEAHRYAEALESAVAVAATRYRVGDRLTAEEVTRTHTLPRADDGRSVVAGLISARADAIGVPGYLVDVADPTTIGLGDTFVGGFLAALPR